MNRALSRLVPLLLAAALAAVLAVPAPAAGASSQLAGVQSHTLWANVSEAEMDHQLDQMKAANVAITRADVGWSSIEHDHRGDVNNWYLGRLDHLVEGANARGIKLLLMFFRTPCWASTAPESLKQGCSGRYWDRGVDYYPPRDPRDYARALAFLVKRYGDKVYSYEIWNEPNQHYFWETSDPVGRYAALVKAAYPAAKAADPRPIIVAGSLSDSDFEFAEALYRHGIEGSFDAFSVHPYAGDRSPFETDVSSPRYSFILGIPRIHALMRSHGDSSPLWLTEWGWSTCNVRGGQHWQNCVSESTQADYLRRAYGQIRKWGYVAAAIWFKLKNTTTSASDRTGNFGLITQDDRLKPAFYAFRSVAAGMQGGPQPPVEPPVVTPPPTTAPPPVRRPRTRRRAVVHVERRGRYVAVRGRAPSRSLARLLVYRRDESTHRFRREATYRWWFEVGRRGKFHLRLHGPALRRGTWRVVVRPDGGAHWVTAAAVLGG